MPSQGGIYTLQNNLSRTDCESTSCSGDFGDRSASYLRRDRVERICQRNLMHHASCFWSSDTLPFLDKYETGSCVRPTPCVVERPGRRASSSTVRGTARRAEDYNRVVLPSQFSSVAVLVFECDRDVLTACSIRHTMSRCLDVLHVVIGYWHDLDSTSGCFE